MFRLYRFCFNCASCFSQNLEDRQGLKAQMVAFARK
jgi:hypothetical protein